MESNAIFKVLKAGIFTTIQDLGRTGYQQYGVAVAGAMDAFSLRIGNLLVGNKERDAGIEATLIGPTLEILKDTRIAITGGDLSPQLNSFPLPMWKSVDVPAGSILSFGRPRSGCRAYIAVRGGIDVPVVMGSRSTYIRAGIGGYQGRPLMEGDILTADIDKYHDKKRWRNRSLAAEAIPHYTSSHEIRVLLGPHLHLFTERSIDQLLNHPFTISPASDRMGYRLKGERLQLKAAVELISEATPAGTIQVPAQGDPIILLADRQTTGGYPKIGTCITVDLPRLAQAKPGDLVRFHPVTLEESHQLLKEQERFFHKLRIAASE